MTLVWHWISTVLPIALIFVIIRIGLKWSSNEYILFVVVWVCYHYQSLEISYVIMYCCAERLVNTTNNRLGLTYPEQTTHWLTDTDIYIYGQHARIVMFWILCYCERLLCWHDKPFQLSVPGLISNPGTINWPMVEHL